MVYVVERYLPGLSRADLLPRLSRLEPVIEELLGEGSLVRYLGSTIVLEDEACFCQFEASSVAAVTDANRRADLPFDRIVPAVLVQPTHRSSAMSVATSIPKTAVRRRSYPLAAIAAITTVVALAAWAIATYAVHSGVRSMRSAPPTEASVLRQLTPAERAYVLAITSMSPAEVGAAFGTDLAPGVGPGFGAQAVRSTAPTLNSVLRSLTSSERRYVLGVTGLTPRQLSAGFGNSPTPPAARGGTAVASPILPSCWPRSCWHAVPSTATSR
jgi:Protein of unknown function (DUF4242)